MIFIGFNFHFWMIKLYFLCCLLKERLLLQSSAFENLYHPYFLAVFAKSDSFHLQNFKLRNPQLNNYLTSLFVRN